MRDTRQEFLPGFKFELQIPQVEGQITPYFTANCAIVAHTEQEIRVLFTVGDWLMETFTLPTPCNLYDLPYSMYLSVREIVSTKRVEFLCTL